MHTEAHQTTSLNAEWYNTVTTASHSYSIGDNYAEPFYRTGWVCPKCGRVLSPDTTACPCSEPGKTTVTTTTGTAPYWESLPKTYSSNLEDYLDELNKQSERELTEEEKKELWRKFYCSAIQNTNI